MGWHLGTAGEGNPPSHAFRQQRRFYASLVFLTVHELAGIRSSGLCLPTDEQLEEQVITVIFTVFLDLFLNGQIKNSSLSSKCFLLPGDHGVLHGHSRNRSKQTQTVIFQ